MVDDEWMGLTDWMMKSRQVENGREDLLEG
jgi:hypothetical protein